MTGLVTMSLVGGAALAAAVTLPLTRALGGRWDLGLALWAIPGVAALAAWAPIALRAAGHRAGGRPILPVEGLRRDGLAWAVTLFMGRQSAWPIACWAGWRRCCAPAEWTAPRPASPPRCRSWCRSPPACSRPWRPRDAGTSAAWPFFLSASATRALIGMILGPRWGIWPLAVVQGIGQGGLFALAVMLIVLGPDAHGGRPPVQHVPYHRRRAAASGPLLIGMLHHGGGFPVVFHRARARAPGLHGPGRLAGGPHARWCARPSSRNRPANATARRAGRARRPVAGNTLTGRTCGVRAPRATTRGWGWCRRSRSCWTARSRCGCGRVSRRMFMPSAAGSSVSMLCQAATKPCCIISRVYCLVLMPAAPSAWP